MTSERSGDIYLALTRIVILNRFSVSSAGAPGASDEERGSSSSIIPTFAFSLRSL